MGIAHRWCSPECDERSRAYDYRRQKDKGIVKSCFEVKSTSKQLFFRPSSRLPPVIYIGDKNPLGGVIHEINYRLNHSGGGKYR